MAAQARQRQLQAPDHIIIIPEEEQNECVLVQLGHTISMQSWITAREWHQPQWADRNSNNKTKIITPQRHVQKTISQKSLSLSS